MPESDLFASEAGLPVDVQTAAHFRDLRQVFLYINDQCNLGCKQCIYKPHVTYHGRREIPLDMTLRLLRTFRDLGARKLTLLGGEPTLYGAHEQHRPLAQVLGAAREMGFDYLRLDTNGHFGRTLYSAGGLMSLDELAFSLDGHDSMTNDLLRGSGTYERIVAQIERAVDLGLRCSITCCLHQGLMRRGTDGVLGVERVIRLAESLGVSVVNFHDLFKAGVPMDTWTGDFDTSVEAHVHMYNEIRPKIEAGEFSVQVRLPQCFVTKEEFARNREYYGYCPVKLGERVMVHTDGVIRICSNLICSSFGTAHYSAQGITWNATTSNEILHHDMGAMTPCTNRSRNKRYGDYVPLCFSFKPNQDEPVWRGLGWDERRSVELVPAGAESAMPVLMPRRPSIPVTAR